VAIRLLPPLAGSLSDKKSYARSDSLFLFFVWEMRASIALVFASALFGIAGWGLYGFRNWARLLTLAISVFTFLLMLGSFPPFFVDSFAAMTAFLPFVVSYGQMVFYLKRENVRQLFA
jgi:hypothetical protein